MNAALEALALPRGLGQDLLLFALVLTRCLPWVVQTPFLGGRTAPPEVRLALALLLATVAHPAARGALGAPLPAGIGAVALFAAREVLRGFVLGYASHLAFAGFEMGGRLMDTVRGASLAEVLDPHAAQRTTPLGDLHQQLFLAVFVATGAHRPAVASVVGSFAAWPLDAGLPDGVGLPLLVARLVAGAFGTAVLLAAPVVAVTLATDVAFGLLNRVAPQLNAWVLAMPLKALAALGVVALGAEALVASHGETAAWVLDSIGRLVAVGSAP
jgi:type III secretory pathway component EscT